MRASRLLSILILLQLRTRLTAQALAAEFGVSERTIYRDIDELSAAGVPVYGERGLGGGFQLLDGWQTKLTGLLPDEAESMALIGLPGAASQLGLGPSTQRLRHKLLAALPGDNASLAGRLQDRFHVDPVDWYRAPEPATHLPTLTRAVLDQQAVSVRYESWRGVSERVLQPLGLVLKAGSWYVVAQSQAKGQARVLTYKVVAMDALRVLPQHFERPRRFDLAAHWAEAVQRFEAGLRPGRARLRVGAQGRWQLARMGQYAAQAVAAAGPADVRGWSELTLPTENTEQAAQLVLSLGPEVEVLEPAELRQLVARWAGMLARRHQGSVKRR
jgi:predicted DNA-binding transcriptional regulator YafY